MKVDFLRKAKWYIVGFILIAVMLSVSLSFSAWDTLSAKAIMNAKGGDFKEKPNTKYVLATDNNGNSIADVGDIVTFGNYYQELTQTGEIAEKTPIRWIVVDITNRQDEQGKQLTLLAEKVIAFGSFWGTYYHNGSTTLYGTQVNGTHYQNYSQSTVRAWLNSVKDDSGNPIIIRNDGGPEIASNKSPSGVQFKGFMSEAFTADEQTYILPKTISGMKGYGKDNNPSTPTESYATVTDKVWLPSWSEVYGTTTTQWGTTQDGSPSARFSYFNSAVYNQGNPILNGYTTAFASSQYSNYTWTNATHAWNYQSSAAGGNVWWWLRSPSPSDYSNSLVVGTGGSGGCAGTDGSHGGVRPAVCVQL